MTLRLSTKLAEWVEEDLPPMLMGDKIEFELSVELHPQAGPVCMVIFFAPGPLLGTTILAASQLENPAQITRDGLTQVLAGMLKMVSDERTKQLSPGGMGTQTIHPTNGAPGAPGGHLRGL